MNGPMKTDSVSLISNGNYWQAAWYDSRGRRRRKSLGAKAKVPLREAKARCRELASSHAVTPARRDVGRAPALGEWCERYAALRTHELAPATLALVKVAAGYLIEHFGRERRIDRITRADLEEWIAWLARRKLADPTLRKHARAAKGIFAHAVRLDLLPFNPADRLRSAAVPTERRWADLSAADVAAFVAACRGPYQQLAALCAYAGLRRSEALRLQWEDVLPDRILVRHEGRSTTKRRGREVMLVAELRTLLRPTLCQGIGVNVERSMRDAMKRAGLTPWSKPLHTLRAWRATTWRAEYPDFVVNHWLGHSQAVAIGHYAKAVPDTYYGRPAAAAPDLESMTPEQLRALQDAIAAKLTQS